MEDSLKTVKFVGIEYDKDTHSFNIDVDVLFLFFISLIIGVVFLYKFFKWRKKTKVTLDLESVTLNLPFKMGKYTIKRSYENLEIANKIYIELITRKAAIPIDEKNDILKEVYDSWYNLFKITRDEVKSLPGKALIKRDSSDKLIQLTCDILNKGLRPHLSKHQAAFRRWFAEELEKDENKGVTPQEIQKRYNINEELNYDALIKSMKEVNQLLIGYANKLKEFITSG